MNNRVVVCSSCGLLCGDWLIRIGPTHHNSNKQAVNNQQQSVFAVSMQNLDCSSSNHQFKITGPDRPDARFKIISKIIKSRSHVASISLYLFIFTKVEDFKPILTYFLIFLKFFRFPVPTIHNIFNKNTKYNVVLIKNRTHRPLISLTRPNLDTYYHVRVSGSFKIVKPSFILDGRKYNAIQIGRRY